MTQYRKIYQEMYEANKELFDNFLDIHNEYAADPQKWQKIFNEYGKEVVEVMREYERKLCTRMGSGMYSKFSANLADKFWAEIKKTFPKIDFVGVTTD